MKHRVLKSLSLLTFCLLATTAFSAVLESSREIPIAKEVDVLVVGGSTGAASAALAAAEAGAKVYLITPKTYLGEDLCGTLRLWLNPDEKPSSPLAQRLFAVPNDEEPNSPLVGAAYRDPNALPFTYEASLPTVLPHKDTTPPTRLKDGLFTQSSPHSVQYNGDVTLTADLGDVKELSEIKIALFYRPGGDFNPATVAMSTSADQKTWTPAGTHACSEPQGEVILIAQPVSLRTRYVKFEIKRTKTAKRVLVGEIMFIGAGKAPAESIAKSAAPTSVTPPLNTNDFVKIAKPMQIKRTLDEVLLAAKVDFLFSSYASDLVVDADGKPCGVVMANRSGRQAILAKVIIDATPRAIIAQMAGAQCEPYPAGEQTFYRIVVGGDVKNSPNAIGRRTGYTFKAVGDKGISTNQADVIEYTLRLKMPDASFGAFAGAEQQARDLTFTTGLLDSSEDLFQVPPDVVRGAKTVTGNWAGAAAVDLDAFRPAGVNRLFVLSGRADITRDMAAKLLRPLAFIDVGRRVGQAAAAEAKGLSTAKGPKVAKTTSLSSAPVKSNPTGQLLESLTGLRPTQKAKTFIPSPDRDLPVLGVYDVVVIGGGTGGAPAGIGAGRGGAKTLLVEYLYGLGGVSTLGLIGKYYHGYRGGFTAETDKAVESLHATNYVVGKAEWWRQENRRLGTEIWFGVLGCGAYVEKGLVKGVILATPHGRGLVLAKTVIDSTGNADVAAAAGAKCAYTEGDDVAVQGTGLPPLELGAFYTNTDYMFADDTDVVDFWHQYVLARQRFKNAYDLGQLMDTRERQRIVGDITISPMDIILGRTWPDTLVFSMSNFDSHGYTVHPLFVAMPPDKKSLSAYVPLRALTPKGLDGILVTGLGISAHRDAMPVLRMQPDVQNQGYACGYAAAMVAKSSSTIRQVDMKSLQAHLVKMTCLPTNVLSDKDSFPLPRERVAQAVTEVVAGGNKEVDGVIRNRDALAVLFSQPQDAIPLLEKAHATATGTNKLAYAHILGMLGSKAGADTLIAEIKNAATFDTGWNYRGGGQFGRSMSELDSYIVALGRTRDPRTLQVVLDKVKLLDATKEFSHHRVCAMALELLGDPRAAAPLAAVLRKPNMMGHATPDVDEARRHMRPGKAENIQRNDSLRELTLARALYRCGDQDGLGEKILNEYAQDLRGHYARHAQAVLAEGKKTGGNQ